MVGLGITMPVLPFYVERLALAEGATRQEVVIHIGLLTGVYALGQFIFAPLWGIWSDRIGRRPLILIGIIGNIATQLMFGLSTSLWLLYTSRIVGGSLTAATMPVSAAYVADITSKEKRGRGMAWLGTAVSLGVVIGPALGALLSRRDWHFNWSAGHFKIDSFTTPFFVAALVGLLTLLAALFWLPESLPEKSSQDKNRAKVTSGKTRTDLRTLVKKLSPLLALTFAGQFALTMFEGTFALFAQAKFEFGPAEVGYVFVLCGLVMAVFQAGVVGFLAGKISEMVQVGAGFALMGAGIALLATAQTTFHIYAFVTLLAVGMAFIAPNLLSLISKNGGDLQAGGSLGFQNAANSLGQAGGPLSGSVLFLWQPNMPYFFNGALLVVIALGITWQIVLTRRAVEP